jgi:hypothetical protein
VTSSGIVNSKPLIFISPHIIRREQCDRWNTVAADLRGTVAGTVGDRSTAVRKASERRPDQVEMVANGTDTVPLTDADAVL